MLPPRGLNRKGNGYAIQPFASIGSRMGQALDDLSLDQEHPDGTVARASGCKLGLGSGGASTATSIRWRPTSSGAGSHQATPDQRRSPPIMRRSSQQPARSERENELAAARAAAWLRKSVPMPTTA